MWLGQKLGGDALFHYKLAVLAYHRQFESNRQ
jgi:hypothetical protein